ncbi:MAG: ribbon-helix-helix domain-containing protein [Streptococcaceae bacterium]|nr:ribbon-helix-helix domain-containing protein [Streptococcaceae bacterium]MCL2858940.1 ribbon-helix-helix domain-containing protein [Streptococcaceae bacterium]
MPTKNTSIRFDESLHNQLSNYAKQTEQSVSAVVEEAVATYLTERNIVTDHKKVIDDVIHRFTPLLEKLKDR